MAGLTLEKCESKLDTYLAAEDAVLKGQEYWIDGVKLTRADLDKIQAGIDTWNRRIMKLGRSGRLSVTEVIPR